MEEEKECRSHSGWGQHAREMENMFRDIMEAVHIRFDYDKPAKKGSRATNDSLTSSGGNNSEEQVVCAHEHNP